ncbi:MAG TPA: response regulator [Spirochaetota bacterium]|nr:response regulator [Spirochaetota bacterium]
MEKKTSMLIIDDEDIVIKSCQRILQKDNIEIDTAYSGEAGLKLAEKKDYDIVLTDLKMPGISGMDVLKSLTETKHGATVIIFTGYATVESAREALKRGAFDYIPKPFTPDELRDVVRNAIAARAEKGDARMLDLMAIVSHELKSPVSVVHTTADTLYRGYFGNLDPAQQKTIETIIRNCQYLEDIIRSYIDLSKMELDDLESFKTEINLVEDVITPVIEVPENSANMKQMPIETDFAAIPPVQGDPNLLKIVVTNLVSNAIKYGKAGTPIKLRLEKQDGAVVFSVHNEGVGISKEDIEKKLFSKFGRLKQKGTEGVKGSGLGLYICKKIVEKHSGKIWVDSEAGSWVRFNVSLPA